jgi:DNA-binding response OmpR family regulator
MISQQSSQPAHRQLRIFCVEDNVLLVLDLQMMIEDAGHIYAGSAARFDEVKSAFEQTGFDLALIDIDLADGRTGGLVAQWLQARGKPSFFLTGQDQLAAEYGDISLGTIAKPVAADKLYEKLRKFEESHVGR